MLLKVRDELQRTRESFQGWSAESLPCALPTWRGLQCDCNTVVGMNLTEAAYPDLPLNVSPYKLVTLLSGLHLQALAAPDAGVVGQLTSLG